MVLIDLCTPATSSIYIQTVTGMVQLAMQNRHGPHMDGITLGGRACCLQSAASHACGTSVGVSLHWHVYLRDLYICACCNGLWARQVEAADIRMYARRLTSGCVLTCVYMQDSESHLLCCCWTRWCSWSSHLSYTQEAPSSILGRVSHLHLLSAPAKI